MTIFFITREGIRWKILPNKFPPKSTVHRWYQRWSHDGTLKKATRKILRYAEKNDLIKLSKTFVDGMLIRSKNGTEKIGKTKC